MFFLMVKISLVTLVLADELAGDGEKNGVTFKGVITKERLKMGRGMGEGEEFKVTGVKTTKNSGLL